MPPRTPVNRRTALVLAASIPLAGCTALLEDEPLLEGTVTDDEPGTFEAEAGDDLEVTVAVEESPLPGGVIQLQVVGLAPTGAVPLLVEFVTGTESFETTAETDGKHGVFVSGTARVTVERI